MASAFILYLILTPAHKWEFLAIEHVDSFAYCEMLSFEVERVVKDQPGKIRIVCVENEETGI